MDGYYVPKDGVEYLLRGICIHRTNKSHNLPLILGLNCVYIFPCRRYAHVGVMGYARIRWVDM